MGIEQLIASQSQRTAGLSPMEMLSGMQSLEGQKLGNESRQIANTAGLQALDKNQRQRALSFAANVGVQLKKEADPVKRQQIYGSALELARMNGYEMTPFPKEYNDQAQGMLDAAYYQVYAPAEMEARLKGRGISMGQAEFNDHVNSLAGAVGPDGVLDPSKLTLAQRASAIKLRLIPGAQGSAAITAATQGLTDQVARSEAAIKGASAGASETAKLNSRLGVEPELKRQSAAQAAIGKTQGEVSAQLPQTIATADHSIELLDKVINHPGLDTATGASSKADPRNFIPGTDAYNFNVLMDQVQGRTFLQAFDSLKGGGAITEVEGKKAEQSIARLNTAQSKEEFVSALNELKSIISAGKDRARERAGKAAPSIQAAPAKKQGGLTEAEQKELDDNLRELGL